VNRRSFLGSVAGAGAAAVGAKLPHGLGRRKGEPPKDPLLAEVWSAVADFERRYDVGAETLTLNPDDLARIEDRMPVQIAVHGKPGFMGIRLRPSRMCDRGTIVLEATRREMATPRSSFRFEGFDGGDLGSRGQKIETTRLRWRYDLGGV